MRVPLDRNNQTPLYRQIQDFLRSEIRSGALAPGTRLPASRALAASLAVSRLTITDAYASLESEGLVCSRPGSGTYVAAEQPPVPAEQPPALDWPLWQQELLSHVWLPAQHELDQMAANSTHAGLISFAAGLGDSSLFPVKQFQRALHEVLGRDGRDALGYGDRAGYQPLRSTIAHILAIHGIQARPEQLLITSGAQQGLALIARLLLRPGDVVLVESPTYAGAIDLFRSLEVRLAGVPVDDEGMRMDLAEEALRIRQPRLIYTMPTFQNPTGSCLPLGRRRQLLALADRYNVPLVEDEFAGDLRYEGTAPPPLAALDPGGRVIYMGTFSKMLMPGLRMGYLLAPGPVYDRLLAYKRVDDLASSSLIQRALETYITIGRYQAHLQQACQLYRRRRDAMAEALWRYLPEDAYWRTPAGGLFIWLRLPRGLSSEALVPFATEEGVAFAPGALFFGGGRPQPYLRLNFAEHPPETIAEGIRRLGRAIARCLAQTAELQMPQTGTDAVDPLNQL